jgi:hypothetical protein
MQCYAVYLKAAQQEYKEAIAEGKGAYLLNEGNSYFHIIILTEEPDVFTCNVGNIPPMTKVVIKVLSFITCFTLQITYVNELVMNNGNICFRFPAKVAAAQHSAAINANLQHQLESIDVSAVRSKFGLQVMSPVCFSSDRPQLSVLIKLNQYGLKLIMALNFYYRS